MIKPIIGRVVLYNDGSEQRVPALICCVHSDQCINIGGFDQNGNPFGKTSVTLVQDDSLCGVGQAEWMAYQKGQAARKAEPPLLIDTTTKTSKPSTDTGATKDAKDSKSKSKK